MVTIFQDFGSLVGSRTQLVILGAGKCANRHFAAAEQGALDNLVEVFFTGPEKGFGLRATTSIKSGDMLGEYLGEVVPPCQVTSWQYAMLLKHGAVIDAAKAGGLMRFMNHSCAPNCYAQRWVVDGFWRIGLFANADVHPGEELTFSYRSGSRQGFGAPGEPERCYCGAKACSGFIVGGVHAAASSAASICRSDANAKPKEKPEAVPKRLPKLRGLKRKQRMVARLQRQPAVRAAKRTEVQWARLQHECDLLYGNNGRRGTESQFQTLHWIVYQRQALEQSQSRVVKTSAFALARPFIPGSGPHVAPVLCDLSTEIQTVLANDVCLSNIGVSALRVLGITLPRALSTCRAAFRAERLFSTPATSSSQSIPARSIAVNGHMRCCSCGLGRPVKAGSRFLCNGCKRPLHQRCKIRGTLQASDGTCTSCKRLRTGTRVGQVEAALAALFRAV
eukprot:5938092-Amphidinium_carterae.1